MFWAIWGQTVDAGQVLGHPVDAAHRSYIVVDGVERGPTEDVVFAVTVFRLSALPQRRDVCGRAISFTFLNKQIIQEKPSQFGSPRQTGGSLQGDKPVIQSCQERGKSPLLET